MTISFPFQDLFNEFEQAAESAVHVTCQFLSNPESGHLQFDGAAREAHSDAEPSLPMPSGKTLSLNRQLRVRHAGFQLKRVLAS